VPKECGIGISRGTVCRLKSGGQTLDYSGHVLNLAARLMDFARPSGVVMHASLANMIPHEFKDDFEPASVYVRGITEHQPMPVYVLKGVTAIPQAALCPPAAPWGSYTQKIAVATIRKLPRIFSQTVPSVVRTKQDVLVRFFLPWKDSGSEFLEIDEFNIVKHADLTDIEFDTGRIKSAVADYPEKQLARIEIRYRQR
jgi:hypothetical protein